MRAPKYALSENVMTLKLGQSKEQVSKILGIEPYFVVSADDTQTVFLYKYRVADRATLPFLMKATNGKKVRGKFINLLVTYDSSNLIKSLKSCDECDKSVVDNKKFDINQIILLFTVVLPAVLIFFGLKAAK